MKVEWAEILENLGFTSIKQLLSNLYHVRGMTLVQMEKYTGVSKSVLHRLMLEHEIPRRVTGHGFTGRPQILRDVSSEELFSTPIAETAVKYNSSIKTVINERKRRRVILYGPVSTNEQTIRRSSEHSQNQEHGLRQVSDESVLELGNVEASEGKSGSRNLHSSERQVDAPVQLNLFEEDSWSTTGDN